MVQVKPTKFRCCQMVAAKCTEVWQGTGLAHELVVNRRAVLGQGFWVGTWHSAHGQHSRRFTPPALLLAPWGAGWDHFYAARRPLPIAPRLQEAMGEF